MDDLQGVHTSRTTGASQRLRTLSGDHFCRVGEKDGPGEGRGLAGSDSPLMSSPGSSVRALGGLR